jgi:hypothetical protein
MWKRILAKIRPEPPKASRSPEGVGAETPAVAATETLRAAASGPISTTVKGSYFRPVDDPQGIGLNSRAFRGIAQRCFAASLIADANAATPPKITVKTGFSISIIRLQIRFTGLIMRGPSTNDSTKIIDGGCPTKSKLCSVNSWPTTLGVSNSVFW